MELKHATKLQKGFDIRLLIVPYGIETRYETTKRF